ncbi:alpha/beta fold hydrolase [Bernardetia sp. OM2101]|uniref:alpha/beta fold hydrolase n=1 Tax=Bernardetia sp. OM2101 TaxID=3344876 RepID=UPI0035D0D516
MSPFFKSIFRRKRTYIFLFLVIGLQLISSCMQFRISDRKVKKEFKDQKFKPTFEYVEFEERKIHYAKIGNNSFPTLFFIHGSPGDWSAFLDYFKDSTLLERTNMVALDRTGYGKSDFGNYEKNLKEQARFYKGVLEKYQDSSKQKPILVAHSYGGAVVLQMAIDYPEMMSGVVVLAGLSSAELTIPRWYNGAAKSIFVRWWLPTALTVSNKEMLHLQKDLKAISTDFDKINVPLMVLHGQKDRIVPYEHALFTEEKLKNNPSFKLITLPQANHFIPWTHQDTVRNLILKMLDETK